MLIIYMIVLEEAESIYKKKKLSDWTFYVNMNVQKLFRALVNEETLSIHHHVSCPINFSGT